MEWLSEYGLWGLVLSVFLAAIANVAGSAVNYALGRWGQIPSCTAGFIYHNNKQMKLNNNLITMENGVY